MWINPMVTVGNHSRSTDDGSVDDSVHSAASANVSEVDSATGRSSSCATSATVTSEHGSGTTGTDVDVVSLGSLTTPAEVPDEASSPEHPATRTASTATVVEKVRIHRVLHGGLCAVNPLVCRRPPAPSPQPASRQRPRTIPSVPVSDNRRRCRLAHRAPQSRSCGTAARRPSGR